MKHILFGPHGTLLETLERERGIPGLSSSTNILNGSDYGKALSEIAVGYLRAGSTVAATNTFGLRRVLKEKGGEDIFERAVAGHVHVLSAAIRSVNAKVSRVLSFGPAADCYKPKQAPSRAEARDFHGLQAHQANLHPGYTPWFETINTIDEGVGIALASRDKRQRCVISFVLNGEGNLLSGESPRDAIRAIDSISENTPLGYGFNCCPREALDKALVKSGVWAQRVVALYPNASDLSADQLDGKGLTDGVQGVESPLDVAREIHELAHRFNVAIIGGCCGHDHESIGALAQHQNQVPQVSPRWSGLDESADCLEE